MNRDIFEHLCVARSRKISVALVTRLSDGYQSLYEGKGVIGDLTLTNDALVEIRAFLDEGRSGILSTEKNLFVRSYLPPIRLLIVGGAMDIAQVLMQLASLAGFETIIIDRPNELACLKNCQNRYIFSEFPAEVITQLVPDAGTAVVTLTGHVQTDDEILIAALKSSAFYIGVLSSECVHTERIARLTAQDISVDAQRINTLLDSMLYGSAPAEIAVSILAEIILIKNKRVVL